MTTNEQLNTEYGLIPGPNWTEECGHGGYIASYEYLGHWYDIYVFDSPHYGQAACIRYGNDAPEYYSFHSLSSLYKNPGTEIFDRAVSILEHYGQIHWKRIKNADETLIQD